MKKKSLELEPDFNFILIAITSQLKDYRLCFAINKITESDFRKIEDYELLFTIDINDFDKIKGNPNFSIIGHMAEENEGIHLVTRANTKIALEARGWDALSE